MKTNQLSRQEQLSLLDGPKDIPTWESLPKEIRESLISLLAKMLDNQAEAERREGVADE